jgi:hypothetical protein
MPKPPLYLVPKTPIVREAQRIGAWPEHQTDWEAFAQEARRIASMPVLEAYAEVKVMWADQLKLFMLEPVDLSGTPEPEPAGNHLTLVVDNTKGQA